MDAILKKTHYFSAMIVIFRYVPLFNWRYSTFVFLQTEYSRWSKTAAVRTIATANVKKKQKIPSFSRENINYAFDSMDIAGIH